MDTANTNSVKNKLMPRNSNGGNGNSPAKSFTQQLTEEFTKIFPQVKTLVPKHVTPERLMRMSTAVISRTPNLGKCTIPSLIGAVTNCAIMGLEPNLIGHAYLVPFWSNKLHSFECNFMIGYRGLIDLCRRGGDLANIFAIEVYKNDIFYYEYGFKKNLIHVPFCMLEIKASLDPDFQKLIDARFPGGLPSDEGPIVGYYSAFELKDGTKDFVWMTRKQAYDHAMKYSKSKTKEGELFGPWLTEFDEMAKKTCIRKMSKYMPLSIEVAEHIQKDDAVLKKSEIAGALGACDVFTAEYTVTEEDEPKREIPADIVKPANIQKPEEFNIPKSIEPAKQPAKVTVTEITKDDIADEFMTLTAEATREQIDTMVKLQREIQMNDSDFWGICKMVCEKKIIAYHHINQGQADSIIELLKIKKNDMQKAA